MPTAEALEANVADVKATLKRAGLSQDVGSYKQAEVERAARAPKDMTGESLRKHIMGNGSNGKGAGKPRAKYSDREVAVRESAMKFAEGGRPIVPPITPVQVRRVIRAVSGPDPYSEGNPLDGLTKKDAVAVARDGGRTVSTRSIGDWKKRHSSLTKEPNRKIVAICVAMTKVEA